jgi:hypothetical protein
VKDQKRARPGRELSGQEQPGQEQPGQAKGVRVGSPLEISRRTLTRGTAWTAPVALVAVAAPAFAASTSCLTAKWTEAIYSGGGGKWDFCFEFSNCGDGAIKVTQVDVYTTYHSPATNATTSTVLSRSLNVNVPATATASNPVTQCMGKQGFAIPPDGPNNLTEDAYYNDFPVIDDGAIACVAKQGSPVYPSSPLYPDSCKRLADDSTYIIFTYTGPTGVSLVRLDMNDLVGCRVTAGCF